VSSGKNPKAAFVKVLRTLLQDVETTPLSGDPARDWIRVKKALRASGNDKLTRVAKHLDYLVAFNRGKRISANLSEMWQRDGQYTQARGALELALAQDQLLDGIDDPNGVQVMTIHKAKGKQFDGVIVVREGRHRAKFHTLILDPAFPR
jgi:DNA helicase-2/ATP-dependent DNA helicase PcrA